MPPLTVHADTATGDTEAKVRELAMMLMMSHVDEMDEGPIFFCPNTGQVNSRPSDRRGGVAKKKPRKLPAGFLLESPSGYLGITDPGAAMISTNGSFRWKVRQANRHYSLDSTVTHCDPGACHIRRKHSLSFADETRNTPS